MKKTLLFGLLICLSPMLKANETDTLLLLTGTASKEWKIIDLEINTTKWVDDNSSCNYQKVYTFNHNNTWNRVVPCDATQDVLNAIFSIKAGYIFAENDSSKIIKINNDTLILYNRVPMEDQSIGMLDIYTTYICKTTTSLNYEIADNNKINVYPNPFITTLTVNFENRENVLVDVFDLTGRIVFQFKQISNQQKIDLSKLNQGNYILKLSSDNEQRSIMINKINP